MPLKLQAGQEIDRVEGADIPGLKTKLKGLQPPLVFPARVGSGKLDPGPNIPGMFLRVVTSLQMLEVYA